MVEQSGSTGGRKTTAEARPEWLVPGARKPESDSTGPCSKQARLGNCRQLASWRAQFVGGSGITMLKWDA